MLGGDHSLKFGSAGGKNPIMTFSHYSGGARAQQQCVGNNRNNCGAGVDRCRSARRRASCRVSAVLYRDQLLNNDWWTYNGYIQDSYSRGRLRINGGLRYDWQTSKYLGGCVPNNPLMPERLPAQCEDATDVDADHRQEDPVVRQLGPARVGRSMTSRGDGKTSVRASYSYYFATKITLANASAVCSAQPALTWGNNTAAAPAAPPLARPAGPTRTSTASSRSTS